MISSALPTARPARRLRAHRSHVRLPQAKGRVVSASSIQRTNATTTTKTAATPSRRAAHRVSCAARLPHARLPRRTVTWLGALAVQWIRNVHAYLRRLAPCAQGSSFVVGEANASDMEDDDEDVDEGGVDDDLDGFIVPDGVE